MIKAFHNQTIVEVNKTAVPEDGNFCMIAGDVLDEVLPDLSPPAFKLYICLAKNRAGYEMIFSQRVVEEMTGIKRRQYQNAIQELVDKGYLVPGEERYNSYTFHDHP